MRAVGVAIGPIFNGGSDRFVTPVNGLLYNYNAVSNDGGLAGPGWRVPSVDDYVALIIELGGPPVAGAAMKTGAFGATLSGYRDPGGVFSGIIFTGNILTSTNILGLVANGIVLSGGDAVNIGEFDFKQGMSVRLIKDSTDLSDGETGVYIGNDGKKYHTICIGAQEWLAGNLMETKYSDGNTIPEVTDMLAWALLDSGARCAYNNDQSLV